MLESENHTYDDDLKFENYEFLPVSYDFSSDHCEPCQRQRPPFIPDGNFPSSGEYPPGFNYPGGVFNPPGMPKSPPPNYTPSKNEKGVQGFSKGYGPEAKAVSPTSIRFCLFKFTYIWQVNGRSYWAYLFNVDRYSISGFRWAGRNWIYFGLSLRRIDAFVCYRTALGDDCEKCKNYRNDNISLPISKKEHSLNGAKDIYAKTLASIDIPQVKEDFATQDLGYLDNNNIQSEAPCVKARNISYRITLEVTYPSDYEATLKNNINEFANAAGTEISKLIPCNKSNNEYCPLEIFNASLTLIPKLLKAFSDSFNVKLKLLNLPSDMCDNINFSIREEKIKNNWKPYFYNDSLF